MAGFVLIHGSFCGGWYFDRVAEMLRAGGHRWTRPTCPAWAATRRRWPR